MIPRTFSSTTTAFSLSELVVVVCLFGMLSAVFLPFLPEAFNQTREHQARIRAEALQGAQLVYRTRVPDADRKWSEAFDDEARYHLLRDAGFLPMSPHLWLAYPPDGFVFQFGTHLSDPVAVLTAQP